MRGYKAGLLSQGQYSNLTQCETLDGSPCFVIAADKFHLSKKKLMTDLRTQLASTDYGNFLANEPTPISTSTIGEKALKNLVDQFNYVRSNAVAPLDKFLDYITSVFSPNLVEKRALTTWWGAFPFQLCIYDRQPRLVDYGHAPQAQAHRAFEAMPPTGLV